MKAKRIIKIVAIVLASVIGATALIIGGYVATLPLSITE